LSLSASCQYSSQRVARYKAFELISSAVNQFKDELYHATQRSQDATNDWRRRRQQVSPNSNFYRDRYGDNCLDGYISPKTTDLWTSKIAYNSLRSSLKEVATYKTTCRFGSPRYNSLFGPNSIAV